MMRGKNVPMKSIEEEGNVGEIEANGVGVE